MASDLELWPGELILGTVRTFTGARVDVTIDSEGDTTLRRRDGASPEWIFRPDERDKLRELLDRAATPGQRGSDGGRQAAAGAAHDERTER